MPRKWTEERREVARILARNLQRAIDKKGISRTALAGHTDLSPSHVTRILKAERLPRLDTMLKLADVLDWSIDDLIDGIGLPPGAAPGGSQVGKGEAK